MLLRGDVRCFGEMPITFLERYVEDFFSICRLLIRLESLRVVDEFRVSDSEVLAVKRGGGGGSGKSWARLGVTMRDGSGLEGLNDCSSA